MSIINWFREKTTPIATAATTEKNAVQIQEQKEIFKVFFQDIQTNAAFKNYAIQLCISRIANAITKCDFETYAKGEYKEGEMWYKLNIEPNKNMSSSKFWNKVIYEMVNNVDGALIIQADDGDLLVADSYSMKTYAVKENVYSNVTVENYMFKRPFTESQVLHFKLNNSKVRKIIDSIYDDYGKLIGGAIRNYNRSNALKYIVELDTTFEQFKEKVIVNEEGEPIVDEDGEPITEYDRILDELFEQRFANFFSEKDSAMPLEKGIALNDMNATGSSKSSGSAANKTTRDITAMFEDILNLAGDAFVIPRGLLKGDVADAEALTDNFIAFCINPIAEQIEDEINRKLYKKQAVLEHTKCKVRTDRIRNYDITKLSTSAELMARIGVFSINRIRRLLNEEPIPEKWADMHLISKNYGLIEELIKGGGMSE